MRYIFFFLLAILSVAAVASPFIALSRLVAPLPANSRAFRTLQLESDEVLPGKYLVRYTARYDFGRLLLHTPAASVVGFVGPNYQRMQVKLLDAKRSATLPSVYSLRGKTRVSGVVRAFSGTLTLEQVRHTKVWPQEAVDGKPLPKIKRTGFALARYELRENPAENRTGVFQGVAVVRWFVDGRNRLRYDDLDMMRSDGFTNNQFVGTWTSYRTRQVSTANWGDFRVPDAGGLDNGADEFAPDAKYSTYGWAGYQKLLGSSETVRKAQQERERSAWWK